MRQCKVFGLFFLMVLVISVYGQSDYARIDIDGRENGVGLVLLDSSKDAIINKMTWLPKADWDKTVCTQFPASKDGWNKASITLKATGDGTINLRLMRSPCFGPASKSLLRKEVLFDDITIEGRELPNGDMENPDIKTGEWAFAGKDTETGRYLSGEGIAHGGKSALLVWHNGSASRTVNVKKGEILKIDAWVKLYDQDHAKGEDARAVSMLEAKDLSMSNGWVSSDIIFIPSKSDESAAVAFPYLDKWGGLLRFIDVTPSMPRAVTADISYRMEVGKGCSKPFFQLSLRCLNDENTEIGVRTLTLESSTEWSINGSGSITVEMPASTRKLRFEIVGYGPAKIQIKKLILSASGGGRSSREFGIEAARGVELGNVIVPGATAPVKKDSEHAFIIYKPKVNFAIDDDQWADVPSYPIACLAMNKEPDVKRHSKVSFQMLCDNEALYVRFESKDNNILDFSRDFFERDGFEFYINADGIANKENGYSRKTATQIAFTRNMRGETEIGGVQKDPSKIKAITEVRKNIFLGLLRIKFATDQWELKPFNGLTFTGNACYNDSDGTKRINKLEYSPNDPDDITWRDSSVFVPFTVYAAAALPYAPVILPITKQTSQYNADMVKPDCKGYFDLEYGDYNTTGFHGYANGDSAEYGISYAIDDKITYEGAKTTCIDATMPDPRIKTFRQYGSYFSVWPNETIVVGFYAKYEGEQTPSINAYFCTPNWEAVDCRRQPLTKDWQWYELPIKLNSKFVDRNAAGMIVIQGHDIRGSKVWLAKRKVVRMTPNPVDVKLKFQEPFAHFETSQKKQVSALVYSGYEESMKCVAQFTIRDFLSGKEVGGGKIPFTLEKEKISNAIFQFDGIKNGFFDLTVSVVKDDGSIMAQSRQAFTTGVSLNGYVNRFIGLWTDEIAVDPDIFNPDINGFIRQCGINSIRMMFGLNQLSDSEIFTRKWDAQLLPLVNAGYEIHLDQASPYFSQNIDHIFTGCSQLSSRYKLKSVSWGNEPNITSGWIGGIPDGREYALVMRTAFNGFKNGNPDTPFIIAGLSHMPVDYLKSIHAVNKSMFMDGNVIGVHCYGDYSDGKFGELLTARQAFDNLYPQCAVWDTESGLVQPTMKQLINTFAKKIPTLMNAGIERHYIYQPWDVFKANADSSPLIPIMMFHMLFYKDAQPLGKVIFSDSNSGFLLKSEGKGKLCLWSKTGDEETINIPVIPGTHASARDQYGNDVPIQIQGNIASISLSDTFIRYIAGVDIDAITKTKGFIPAFVRKNAYSGNPMPDYVTNPYITMEPFHLQFDKTISRTEASSFKVMVRNDGKDEQTVKISAIPDNYMDVKLSPAQITLNPYSKTEVTITVSAKRELRSEPFIIGGTTGTGKKMMELPLSITTAKAVTVRGYSHCIEIVSNDGKTKPVKASFFDEGGDKVTVTPSTITVNPGGSATYPLAVKRIDQRQDSTDIPHGYGITYGWGNETCKAFGSAHLARTRAVKPAFDSLEYEMTPLSSTENFSARMGFYKEKDGIRILIKVADSSPVQTGKGDMASLRDGGDCVIIGIDNPELETGSVYGKGDFECGFAMGGKPESYIWKGSGGYETAKPFQSAVNNIHRDGKYIYYDIKIPADLLPGFSHAERIGFGILIRNKKTDGTIEEIQFGDGFGKNTIVSRFGVLSLMD